ncbi:MAG: flagellar protein export ATPase FliI [Maricaulaceae bacterium]
MFDAAINALASAETRTFTGRVTAVRGLMLEASGPAEALALGARGRVSARTGTTFCEVVGFRDDRAVLLPYGPLDGVRPGSVIHLDPEGAQARPSLGWLGRVVNAFGEPLDGQGPLVDGAKSYPIDANPPPASARGRVGARLSLGVRALDTFAQLCRGQRMGLFAGSGVGKSVLMSMLAKNADCDIAVIGLIGERGREVRELVEDTLGPEGLKRGVVVVASSDEPALGRRQAARLTMAVSEAFRDMGYAVLCLMDTVTRLAMAQREIGLSAGEPPTTKGYTPSVFQELPRLLERAGPGYAHPDGSAHGSITGLFTVLVDGGDHDEPVADAVRGILDGHVVLERAIAERGRYPAINVLKSVSRMMPGCCRPEEIPVIRAARQALSTYADMEELIRMGAYSPGTNAEVDHAIALEPKLEQFLAQDKEEATPLEESFARLRQILE